MTRVRTLAVATVVLAAGVVGGVAGSCGRRPGRASRSPAPRARSSRPTTGGTRTSATLPVHARSAAVALPHVHRQRPAPRLRPVVRRRPRLRHPDHRRAAPTTEGAGALPVRRRERQGALPARQGHPDRGRPQLTGDRHAIVVDRGSCRLYETCADPVRNGKWRAGSGAIWSLRSNALRPDGWTSADAAGLPILPGPAALERGARRPDRPRDPVHHRRDQQAPPLAGPPRRRLARDLRLPADGRAVPAEGVVRRLRPLAEGADRGRGDEEVRPGPRRQRLARGSSRASSTRSGRTG